MRTARDQELEGLHQELKGLLNRWGDWIEASRDYTSLPKQAPFMNVSSGGVGGHRILCPDMPKKLYFLNQAVLKLPDNHQTVLKIFYGVQRLENGAWIDGEDKAKALGMSWVAFRGQVHRARKKLLHLRNIWATV